MKRSLTPVMRLSLLLLASLVSPTIQQCDPSMCVLPNCRCQFDKNPPGGMTVSDIPQMVIVSMQNNINIETVTYFRSLFDNIVNPNSCPARGTFFLQDDGSDYRLVKNLYVEGHEIGIHSLNGTAPVGSSNWISMFKAVLSKLVIVGVNVSDVNGARTPGITLGGDDELIGLGNNNLMYDSSCTNVSQSTKTTYLWPYSFDYPTTDCDSGVAPTVSFRGKWEIPIADLHGLTGSHIPCAVPSACQGVTNKRDAFNLFLNAFLDHYTGNRTPFLVLIDAAWAKNPDFLHGTVEFLEYVRAAFGDNVWVVPAYKALQWVQQPTPMANLSTFAPWGCS